MASKQWGLPQALPHHDAGPSLAHTAKKPLVQPSGSEAEWLTVTPGMDYIQTASGYWTQNTSQNSVPGDFPTESSEGFPPSRQPTQETGLDNFLLFMQQRHFSWVNVVLAVCSSVGLMLLLINILVCVHHYVSKRQEQLEVAGPGAGPEATRPDYIDGLANYNPGLPWEWGSRHSEMGTVSVATAATQYSNSDIIDT